MHLFRFFVDPSRKMIFTTLPSLTSLIDLSFTFETFSIIF